MFCSIISYYRYVLLYHQVIFFDSQRIYILWIFQKLAFKNTLDTISSNWGKESLKIKHSLNSTFSAKLYAVFSPINRHRWCKKSCALIGGARLLESLSISVLISRIEHFSISIKCSWVD